MADARPPPTRRSRKRGPRSAAAVQRRSSRGALPVGGRGQARPLPADALNEHVHQEFSLCLINIRSLRRNLAELSVRLESLMPDVIAFTETWLDEAAGDIHIPGYRVVARRDRTDGRKGGGVALFCRTEIRSIVHAHSSADAERIWCSLHSDLGPLRTGVWHRAPDTAPGEMSTLTNELSDASFEAMGTILLGDVNIHRSPWLRFSSGCSAEGQALRNICDEAGLLQKVREPTRNQYLLDLVLADLSDTLKIEVLPAITDHKLVMSRLLIATPVHHAVTRYVWDFKQARWDGLVQALADTGWDHLTSGSIDKAVETFTQHVLTTARAFIPYRRLRERKSTHPWITPACEAAVHKKIAAEGCPHGGRFGGFQRR